MFPAESTIELETLNRARIVPWWQLAGEQPSYPASTATVDRLLQAVEFESTHERLLEMVDAGLIPSPERDGTRLEWSATDIVAAATALNDRRAWLPFSKIHAAKFTFAERMRQVAEHHGEQLFSDLAEMDLRRLLAALIEVKHDPQSIEWLAAGLQLKLEAMGIWK